MDGRTTQQRRVPALTKNHRILEARRLQIVQAAVGLFVDQGFHKTTTRQIAQAANMSIGGMYEYVRSKEDILYLVCDHIHASIEARLKALLGRTETGREALVKAMAAFFQVCDELSDHVLLIYQETKSLPAEARSYVLANDVRIAGLFREIIDRGQVDQSLELNGLEAELIAHDIVVSGHMWTFRRWRLGKLTDLDQYTKMQTDLLLNGIGRK